MSKNSFSYAIVAFVTLAYSLLSSFVLASDKKQDNNFFDNIARDLSKNSHDLDIKRLDNVAKTGFIKKINFITLESNSGSVYGGSHYDNLNNDNDLNNEQESFGRLKVNFVSSGLVHWNRVSDDNKKVVDMFAADFYVNGLSKTQRENIEKSTVKIYQSFSVDQRMLMREKRKEKWQKLKSSQNNIEDFSSLGYEFIAEYQKMPYRDYGIKLLDIKTPKVAFKEV